MGDVWPALLTSRRGEMYVPIEHHNYNGHYRP